MKQSFVGIHDHIGLQYLHPEHPHTVKFLLRRIERNASRNAQCSWAVLNPDIAACIRRELADGNHQQALLLVRVLSHDGGPILPEIDTDTFLLGSA